MGEHALEVKKREKTYHVYCSRLDALLGGTHFLFPNYIFPHIIEICIGGVGSCVFCTMWLLLDELIGKSLLRDANKFRTPPHQYSSLTN